jgi:hypothetical protein
VASGRAAETYGWMQAEQFKASRHKGRSGWKVLIIETDDAFTVERPDGISRRLDGCKGSNFFDLESVQNFLETYL